MGERRLVIGAAVRQDVRALAAELGVAEVVDAQLAAGCTGIDLRVLEQRRATNVAAATRAAAIYARTVRAPMPGLTFKRTAPRAEASAPVRHGGHAPMPPLTIARTAPPAVAQADTGHAPMPPLVLRAR